jgi:hypothetical protein
MMTDYFIKIALSNGLKRFKSTIPKTKKQALRSKIQTVQHITKDKKNELLVFSLQFGHFHFERHTYDDTTHYSSHDQCSDLDMSVDFPKLFYCTLDN